MNKERLKIYAREELPPARSYYDFAATPSTTLSPEAKSLVSLLPSPIRLIGDSIGRGAADDAGQIPELS